jgi:mRNA-degrading endonuclease toxin of MazEF toxin-antitoxin module
VRRGDLYRYEPVMSRAGQSTTRLIVSADAINTNEDLPVVYAMHVVDSDPGSLLAVRIGEFGWAFALEIDRPPRRRLVEHLGHASPEELEQVDNAIRAAFEV